MLAFLGAVICIIAAVHPGFISAAPQAFSDNESLSHDSVLETLPEGSVAQAGPLGALHGAETTEGIGASVVNGLSNSGRAGSGGRQKVTFSRLICTPVPAGECNPNTFLKQSTSPPLHSDEDWSYLSATAKQLQETILQQKDQILSDQQTIQELIGKLSECEIGLGERSYPGRSAGLWGNRRRLLAGNGHMSPVVPEQQSTLVLEELEQTIIQMKDRIEKLESDTPPTSQNHTGAPQKGQGELPGSRGNWTKAPSRRPQDKLGGKLEAKVQQLEGEGVMLNGEARGHQQEAPEDVDSLWRSIDHLEQSLSGYNFPESYKLLFPVRTDYMYGVVRHPVPEMYAMTACLWLRPKGSGLGTPFSYSIPEQPNELVLLQGVHNPVEILINDKVAQLPLAPQPGKWQHLCVTWSLRDGVWQAYQGGTLKGEGEGLAAWHPIRPGGMLILGQEQDAMGGRFDASQAMVGELSQFNLWDRVLSSSEVADLATCSSALLGNVVPWTNRGIDVFGGATKEPAEPCTEQIGGQ